jgi:hypothetical protein
MTVRYFLFFLSICMQHGVTLLLFNLNKRLFFKLLLLLCALRYVGNLTSRSVKKAPPPKKKKKKASRARTPTTDPAASSADVPLEESLASEETAVKGEAEGSAGSATTAGGTSAAGAGGAGGSREEAVDGASSGSPVLTEEEARRKEEEEEQKRLEEEEEQRAVFVPHRSANLKDALPTEYPGISQSKHTTQHFELLKDLVTSKISTSQVADLAAQRLRLEHEVYISNVTGKPMTKREIEALLHPKKRAAAGRSGVRGVSATSRTAGTGARVGSPSGSVTGGITGGGGSESGVLHNDEHSRHSRPGTGAATPAERPSSPLGDALAAADARGGGGGGSGAASVSGSVNGAFARADMMVLVDKDAHHNHNHSQEGEGQVLEAVEFNAHKLSGSTLQAEVLPLLQDFGRGDEAAAWVMWAFSKAGLMSFGFLGQTCPDPDMTYGFDHAAAIAAEALRISSQAAGAAHTGMDTGMGMSMGLGSQSGGMGLASRSGTLHPGAPGAGPGAPIGTPLQHHPPAATAKAHAQQAPTQADDFLYQVRTRLLDLEAALSNPGENSKITSTRGVRLEARVVNFFLLAKLSAQLHMKKETGQALMQLEETCRAMRQQQCDSLDSKVYSALALRLRLDYEEWSISAQVSEPWLLSHLTSKILPLAKQLRALSLQIGDVLLQRDALKRLINVYTEISAVDVHIDDEVVPLTQKQLSAMSPSELEEAESNDPEFNQRNGSTRAAILFIEYHNLAKSLQDQ